ncbi:hypothetical protein [Haliovirga abyssi]|uniref:Uncharacterized protein n=1 Tax=Haliovirga abyssi TaxID=2996794 RepID=A0AAU9DGZ0_9FUSO|nr:hypothetical protein [Haliovirga abyssi]BDU51563.1 hypothetical protein HLVA_21320 [Haliovirga abyssi]
MAVIEFNKEIRVNPYFGINITNNIARIFKNYKRDESIEIIKILLNISKKRVVEIKEAESTDGNKVIILLLYGSKYISKNIVKEIPENPDGTFAFPVFELDFNNVVDIEEELRVLGYD